MKSYVMKKKILLCTAFWLSFSKKQQNQLKKRIFDYI